MHHHQCFREANPQYNGAFSGLRSADLGFGAAVEIAQFRPGSVKWHFLSVASGGLGIGGNGLAEAPRLDVISQDPQRNHCPHTPKLQKL
jgi:hypothetical protein